MDPYKVLGVSPDADEETIKKAYKELVKKYHPDKYVNNPLADLAAEKMKEINQAYDMIMKKQTSGGAQQQRGGGYGGAGGFGGTGGFGGAGGFGGGYGNVKPTFELVRTLLNMNRPVQAMQVLNQLPKTAEWYYLNGLAMIRRGWYSQGIQSMEQAVKMDPSNTEYSDMLNNVRNRASSYNTGGGMYSSGPDCCSSMLCLCLPCLCPCDCC